MADSNFQLRVISGLLETHPAIHPLNVPRQSSMSSQLLEDPPGSVKDVCMFSDSVILTNAGAPIVPFIAKVQL